MNLKPKNWLPYLFFLLAMTLLLVMSDESREPIDIKGKDLKRESGNVENTSVIIQPDSGYSGRLLTSSSYLLDKGSYVIGLAYNADTEDNSITIYDNGRETGTYPLPPSVTYCEFPVTLERSSPDFQFAINYGGTGNLRFHTASLIPEGRFYNDTAFIIALFLICNVLFLLWRFCFIHRPNSDAKAGYTVLFLAAVGTLASLPYLKTGLGWAIDLCYHLIRVEGIKDGLLAGQFPVVIYPEALHGNGYLNCMYPNLFLYLPAFLRMLGISMADSFKFLIIGFNFATAFLTYHCVKSIGGSRQAALLASLLYTCCPYRFTNIYARGAVGEFLAMTFVPLIFTGLYHIFIGDRKKWGYLVLGMTGLLQTHILSVTLAGIFCVFFGILHLREIFTEKRYLEVLKAVVLSILLNIGFLIPFLTFYKKGNLWMGALDLGTYQEYTLNLSGIAGTVATGDYHMLTLGIPLCACALIACACILFERKKDRNFTYILYLFAAGCIMTFMITNYFPGWRLMEIPAVDLVLSKIQFAWRLLGPVSFLFAVSGSILLFRSNVLKEYSRIIFIVLAGFCLLTATRFRDEDFAYGSGNHYTTGHESKIIGIPKGDNTVVFPYEWRPKNTVDSGIITTVALSDSKLVNLMDCTRNGTTTQIQYSCLADGQYLELPVIFYRGYEAVDENGAPVTLETGYNNKIRVLLTGDGGAHQVTVRYKIPPSFTFSAWLSILTAIIAAAILCVRRFRELYNGKVTGKEIEDVR